MNGHLVYIEGKLFIQESNGNLTPFSFGNMGGGTRKIIQQVSGGGDTIESGEFTILADGSSGTVNGNPVTPISVGVNMFKMTIPTIKKLKLGFFNARVLSDGNLFGSDGRSNGVIQNTSIIPFSVFQPLGQSVCILAFAQEQNPPFANNGWSATVDLVGITNNSYDVIWTKIGNGLPVNTVQWHAITE